MNVLKIARITLDEARMRKIVWAIVLLGIGRLVLSAALHKLVVQGG